MQTTYAILDDDPFFTRWLHQLIKEQHPVLTHLGCYHDTLEASNEISKSRPDILFLDMVIASYDGLEFLESLDYRPHTIVVSASEHYKARAARLGAVDYLVKPVGEQALTTAVGKALWQIRAEREHLGGKNVFSS